MATHLFELLLYLLSLKQPNSHQTCALFQFFYNLFVTLNNVRPLDNNDGKRLEKRSQGKWVCNVEGKQDNTKYNANYVVLLILLLLPTRVRKQTIQEIDDYRLSIDSKENLSLRLQLIRNHLIVILTTLKCDNMFTG